VLCALHFEGPDRVPIYESVIDAPAAKDALHPIEPQAKMSLKEVKDKYGDRACVAGNVDVSSVLPLGTVEQTIMEVKRCLKEAADGGGYINELKQLVSRLCQARKLQGYDESGKKYGKCGC